MWKKLEKMLFFHFHNFHYTNIVRLLNATADITVYSLFAKKLLKIILRYTLVKVVCVCVTQIIST